MAKAEAASRAAPAPKTKINKDELIRYYREMLLIRRFEEKAGQLYGMGLIGGFCHLYIGQEAVVVGMQAAIGEGDQVITAYRDHGHMLACGMDPAGVMAELTGRSGGYSKGKGGSMHMFSREKNFFGGHGIVGAQVPLGTGLAFANKYKGNDRVCLTYFGDGAANQGQVYESFNMAELWKLPVIYVIENNQYAMGTSVQRSSAGDASPQARRFVQHPGRRSRRHGRAGGEGGRRQGREMVPRRQGPDHPGDEDLSLSRAFDVGPGEVSHARGSRSGAREARSDRSRAPGAARREDVAAKKNSRRSTRKFARW